MCKTCPRHDCRSYQQQEAPLSDYRLNRRKPFEITGCDYSGPFNPKESGKVYLIIFTCTTIRAIHLEMCQGLQINEFLLAFRRFQSRFGTPQVILSDNFKTFISAKKLLAQTLDWRFIPEYSPTWGGQWERLTRSVKIALKRILENKK